MDTHENVAGLTQMELAYLLKISGLDQNCIRSCTYHRKYSVCLCLENGEEKVKSFKEKGIDFVPENSNFVDEIWRDRPHANHPAIFIHEEWAGKSIG